MPMIWFSNRGGSNQQRVRLSKEKDPRLEEEWTSKQGEKGEARAERPLLFEPLAA